MVTLTKNQMPQHNHTGFTVNDGNHSHGLKLGKEGDDSNNGSSYDEYTQSPNLTNVYTENDGNHSHAIPNSGGNLPQENRPKFWALAYIMKK